MSYNIEGRIFVGGLDHDCDEAGLEQQFKMFGEISQLLLIRNRETGLSRGFAFISFKESSSAEEAIRRMHGVEVMGRCVTVKRAEKQGGPSSSFHDERSSRGGYRGGRGGRGRGFGRSSGDKGGDYYLRREGHEQRRGGYDNFSTSKRDSGYLDGADDYTSRSDKYESRRNYSSRGAGSFDIERASYGDDFDDLPKNGYNRGGSRYANSRSGNYDQLGGYNDTRSGYAGRKESRSQIYSGSGRSRSPVGRYGRDDSPPIRRRNMSPYDGSSPIRSIRRETFRDYSPSTRGRSGRGIARSDDRRYNASDSMYREMSPQFKSRPRHSPTAYSSGPYKRRADSPIMSRSPPPRRAAGYNNGHPRSSRSFADSRSFQGSRMYESQERSGFATSRVSPNFSDSERFPTEHEHHRHFEGSRRDNGDQGDRPIKRSVRRTSPETLMPRSSRRF